MGRKNLMQNMIGFMVTDAQKQMIKELCRSERRDQSDLLRLLVEEAYASRIRRVPEVRMGSIEMSTLQKKLP